MGLPFTRAKKMHVIFLNCSWYKLQACLAFPVLERFNDTFHGFCIINLVKTNEILRRRCFKWVRLEVLEVPHKNIQSCFMDKA